MEMLGEFQSATAAMADAGVLVDSSPLQPPQTATTVRVRNGEMQLSDGPFAEIKEQLGGYYILDCEDLGGRCGMRRRSRRPSTGRLRSGR
jgi:hypothetical protein